MAHCRNCGPQKAEEDDGSRQAYIGRWSQNTNKMGLTPPALLAAVITPGHLMRALRQLSMLESSNMEETQAAQWPLQINALGRLADKGQETPREAA